MKVSELEDKHLGSDIVFEGEGFKYTGILEGAKQGITFPNVLWLSLTKATLFKDDREFPILDQVVTMKLEEDLDIEIVGYPMAPTKWAAIIKIDDEYLSNTNVSRTYPWLDSSGEEYTVGGVNRMIKDSTDYEVIFGGVED